METKLQVLCSFYNTLTRLGRTNQEAVTTLDVLMNEEILSTSYEDLDSIISNLIHDLNQHVNHLRYLADQTLSPAIDK